jgi:hypothetical protein
LGRFWEGFGAFFRALSSLLFAEQLGYQRVLVHCFSDFLEGSAPALPVIFRSAVIVALAELRVCETGHGMV